MVEIHSEIKLFLEYLQILPDGDCLYNAVLQSVEAPQNYRADDLRCQLASFICSYADSLFPKLDPLIRRYYGEEGPDQSLSFQGYVGQLGSHNAWGDLVALVALSYMWKVKISIVDILSFDVTRVNHSSEVWWQNAILLCYNGRDHFFSLIPPDGGKIPVTTTQVLCKLCYSRFHCFSLQPVWWNW